MSTGAGGVVLVFGPLFYFLAILRNLSFSRILPLCPGHYGTFLVVLSVAHSALHNAVDARTNEMSSENKCSSLFDGVKAIIEMSHSAG